MNPDMQKRLLRDYTIKHFLAVSDQCVKRRSPITDKHIEQFDTMLSLIDLQPEDHLYILGDVFDRGEHGIELLQQIRGM